MKSKSRNVNRYVLAHLRLNALKVAFAAAQAELEQRHGAMRGGQSAEAAAILADDARRSAFKFSRRF